MTTVLQVENISKQYRLGTVGSGMFKEDLSQWWNNLRGKTDPSMRQEKPDYVWALKDVDFRVNQGDVLGIIGNNGAGKSTLLKILSKITAPTTGNVKIKGKIASLLEVGTGFHPELTGRDNIYLNGAILGMTRQEVTRKFDEIVDFAGVERYIDTPVKRYSSGMYVRLAFAVAAHLDNEILIVDEVLAVGDTDFQKKCLGKMGEISKREGRTVLFVSHSMATVTTLCKKAIWLLNGRIQMEGNAELVAQKYITHDSKTVGDVLLSENQSDDTGFTFRRLTLLNSEKQPATVFDVRKPILVRMEYEASKPLNNVEVSIRVNHASGLPLFTSDRSNQFKNQNIPRGIHISEVEIPGHFLYPGTYSITIAGHIPNITYLSLHDSVITFEVAETGSNKAIYRDSSHGVVLVDFPWKNHIEQHS